MPAPYPDGYSLELGRPRIALWVIAAVLAVVAHTAIAFAAFRNMPEPSLSEPIASAIMIDLAPMAVAPEPVAVDSAASEAVEEVLEPVDELQPEIAKTEPVEEENPEQEVVAEPVTEEVPEPVEQVAESQPVEHEPVEHEEMTETVAEEANVVLPEVAMIPPPRPEPAKPAPAKKPVQTAKPVTKPIRKPPPSTAAQRAEQAAPRAAAPAANAGAGRKVSSAKWEARVRAHLVRRLRYPSRTRAHGVAVVRLTFNPNGAITSASLLSSSGDVILDTAAVKLVQRSSPIPAPPPEIAQPSMSLTVPIKYERP